MAETLRDADAAPATGATKADAGLAAGAADPRTDGDWWLVQPEGARLVGLVVARDDMPSVVRQRNELTGFGVPIEGFRHPAPDILETWETRLGRLFDTLQHGDVLVVTSVHALGRDLEEETRTVAELQRRGIIVKVLAHDGRRLYDTGR